MRHPILWTCLVGASLLVSCAKSPAGGSSGAELRSQQVLWRSHFVGGARLEGDPNAARWNKLAADPASVPFREEVLRKLATAPFRAWQGQMAAGAKDQAALLEPLLGDLLHAESYVEWRGTTNQTTQLALAIKLNDDRAKAWNVNLATVLKSWTGIEVVPFNQNGVSGWQLRKHDAPNLLGLARSGPWLVVGAGQDALTLFNEFTSRLKGGGVPFATEAQAWGELWVDGPRVQPRLPFQLPLVAPWTHLTVTGKDGDLRVKGWLSLDRALNWKPVPWRIPFNLIRDPIISFTAARGVAPVLQQSDFLRELNLQPVPDELYAWGLDGFPLQNYLAWPATDAASQFKRLAQELPARYNPGLTQGHFGSLQLGTNQPVLAWTQLPFAVPTLRTIHDGNNDYFFAGVFPYNPKAPAPPRELFKQIEGHNDVAYYDWEVTEPRLKQWEAIVQLYQIVARQPVNQTNMAAMRWLEVAGKGAGNSGTEITVSGERELTLVRKAPLGLTGFEWVALATWIESTNFPFSPWVKPLPPGVLPPRPAKPAAPAVKPR